MKLILIEGQPAHLVCAGCTRDGIGGTDTYPAASSGEERTPEQWYQDPEGIAVYCAECAAKMTAEDPTRSVSQFYADTAGTQIATENL
jgi:hypothetical protein